MAETSGDVVFPVDLNTQPIAALNSSEFIEDSSILPKFGFTSVCGGRPYMEDEVSIHRSLCAISGEFNGHIHYFAVFDGHGCSHIATHCKERMHMIIKEELLNEDGVSINWKNVMKRSFMRIDNEALSLHANLTIATCKCDLIYPVRENVGSTAVVAIVTPDKIIVANCGDSRAVLGRPNKALPLSVDHKPDRDDELKRIEDGGGFVTMHNVARVFGMLAVSRAIGDQGLKPYVISEPEVKIVKRRRNDVCLILGSDGLWDVISNKLAVYVAQMCLERNVPSNIPLPDDDDHLRVANMNFDIACFDASASLTREAMLLGSTDNISVVVVDLRRQQQLHGV